MPESPNVLLIFCDQLRFDVISELGNPVIRTPNLDRLCREGTTFTSAYSPCPVSVPARASLHYGQYPMNTGCYENRDPMPEDGRPSFMQVLADAGHRTHGVGKCHFTPDLHALRGFQTRERQEEGGRSPDQDEYAAFLAERGHHWLREHHGVRGEMYYVPQLSPLPADEHPTQWIGDRCIDFIRGEGTSETPWMLFSSFIHPHPPFAPPSPWHKIYRAARMPLPRVPADAEALLTHINRRQNRYKYRDQGIDQNLLRCMKAHYYACVSFIDYQVGRILAALEEGGRLDDTLVLFTADHGEHLGDYNCFGKRSMHDTCARVPLIVRMPGRFPAASRCDAPVSLVDVVPTILNATGNEDNNMALDGRDLRAIAAGETISEPVFIQYDRGQRGIYAVVTPEWKYAYSAADDREFLFDRVQDPLENRNQAGLVFNRKVCTRLRKTLLDFLEQGGESEAVDGDNWQRYPPLTMPEDPDSGLLVQDPPNWHWNLPGYTDSDE